MPPKFENPEGRSEDADALLRELVQGFGDQLYNDMAHIVGDLPYAERLVEESFLEAYRRLLGNQPPDTFITLFQRALRNVKPQELTKDPSAAYLESVGGQDQALIDALWKELKPEERSLLVLREIENATYDEIAEAFSWDKEKVRSELSRVRFKLLEALKQRGAI